jgi:PAS domain S-box-containing protein
VKKLNQLLIIEAGFPPELYLTQFHPLLQSFCNTPIVIQSLYDAESADNVLSPQIILLHSNLTTMQHLQQFIKLQVSFPYSTIIIVSDEQEEELCLSALEAGAGDCIQMDVLTESYIRKAIVVSLRRNRIEKEIAQSHQQLLACIQNTPNVAVQWYNSKAEVLFWNRASEAIFGWTAKEALGKTLHQLIDSPQNDELWINKIKHITLTDVPPEPQEWSFHHRDGHEGFCISTLFPIPSFSGELWFVCMDVEITGHKGLEKNLQRSKENYHTLFNKASDAIFINDNRGRFLDVNQKACALLNYDKEQLLQMKVGNLFSKEELAAQPIMLKELLSGQRTAVERNMITAGGQAIPVEITAQMLDESRIMAIVRDISERKKGEEALKQSEEKYRSLVEQQADAITIFDIGGKILDVNTSATQMLYYTKDELKKMNMTDILLQEDLKNQPVNFALLRQGEATIKQRRMRRKDGSFVETEVHAKRLSDGLFLASVRDLTERMEVQRRLEKEIELSDSIINNLPGLFYLYKKNGEFLLWNKQFELTSGYSAEEFKTMSPLDFFGGEEVNLVFEAIEKVFQIGEWSVEANLLTKYGTKIPYYFTGAAINYAGTDCLLGMGIDLSAVKNLEKELSQEKIAAQKKVMQAMIDAEEKEKAKLGLELHDNISQILSIVRMYLTILHSNEIPEGVTLSRTIQLLDSAINEIRNLSHSLAISYKFEVGLTEALQEMIDKIRLTRGFSIELYMHTALNEYTNSHQKLAIYRIVQEQMNNIIKYAKASEVAVRINVTNNEVQLKISDNGKGFNPLKVDKGLGLNNITNRAEALGGKVTIQSARGKGCQVMVYLPMQMING